MNEATLRMIATRYGLDRDADLGWDGDKPSLFIRFEDCEANDAKIRRMIAEEKPSIVNCDKGVIFTFA